jgi:hypothetical protein
MKANEQPSTSELTISELLEASICQTRVEVFHDPQPRVMFCDDE